MRHWKKTKVPAATTFRDSVEGVRRRHPDLNVDGIEEKDDLMVGRCPWCKNRDFDISLVQVDQKMAELVEYKAKLSAYLKKKEKREAQALLKAQALLREMQEGNEEIKKLVEGAEANLQGGGRVPDDVIDAP